MKRVVADTHTIIWYIGGDSTRLSSKAEGALDTAILGGEGIAISAITLVEVAYLEEKGRIPDSTYTRLHALMQGDSQIHLIPIDSAICEALRHIDRNKVPDMPDRIIAATALYLDTVLVTRDAKITASNIRTVW